LFLVSSHLASYVLLVVPFVGGFTIVFRKLARRVSRIYRKSEAQINSSISESVEGIQIAKSYGREKAVLERFQKVNLVNYRAGLRQTLTMMLLFPTIDLLLGITILAILSIGGAAALAGQYGLSGANLYLFVMYLNTFFYPLMTMASFYGQLQSGFAAFERIATVLDAEPEVKQTGNTVLTGLDGDIKFENVSFSYNEKAQVLENFSLHIKPGEKLAIVGHTGAGKTSIINLIARFYEFQSGRLLVDDNDIRTLSLESYMSFLGIVQQDPFLFAGSVEENIKYGRSGASEDDVLKAIRSTKVDEFLKYLPEGLQTDVQERGKRLSTGQRQLVCFARALLADPRILILDEATSSVDAYTESIIQQALETLMEQRTSIVIAHRLSTVVNADRIIVLDHGKIIEEGSHEYLLTKKGKYQELFETYFKHQAPDWEPKVETKEILTPVATEY
ncbi:MAG TPA: ABC transporter ATP-binding protein, partial [Candidatus Hodarchaeales archaeon]|nr:ABC transporter ATP-binding protein [Candidatus Hodarchaeales archaeon]